MDHNRKKSILPQLYDIRPIKKDGSLDFEKINRVNPIAEIDTKAFIKRHLELKAKKSVDYVEMETAHILREVFPTENFEKTVPIKNIKIIKNENKDEEETWGPKEKDKPENTKSFQAENILEINAGAGSELEKSYFSRNNFNDNNILADSVKDEYLKPDDGDLKKGYYHRDVLAESPLGEKISEYEIDKFTRKGRRAKKEGAEKSGRKTAKKYKKETISGGDYFSKIFIKSRLAENEKNYLAETELSIFNKFWLYILSVLEDGMAMLEERRNRVAKGPVFWKKSAWEGNFYAFASIGTAIFAIIFSISYVNQGIKIKQGSTFKAQRAYADLVEGKNDFMRKDYHSASLSFTSAYETMDLLSKDFSRFGMVVVETSKYIPFLSKISTGQHLSNAGKSLSRIGIKLTELMEMYDEIKNPLGQGDKLSYLDIFKRSKENIETISGLSREIEADLAKVNIDDIPLEQRDKIIEMKEKLPQFNDFFDSFLENDHIFMEILGGNGPRKYLVLFQNNQEMRATGGFIGTYAIIDIFNGRVKQFFVDGIFNPDGQLKEKVVPPIPIQKISAAWSLHDSNWFPDFPVSAEKACWFYEKTGGPTVDGVIAMTPEVLLKLLEITGPIEMPEYDLTVDKDNFVSAIQHEVEFDYDKELNQPKKILSDLAPIILDRIFNGQDISNIVKTMKVFGESLDEKHILIYSKNYEIEKKLSEKGWTGEVMKTEKDYLSVINTNINGFKTDGVIDETIEHRAEIQKDGSIIDEVRVVRRHNGGDSDYEFWNKVNADYMRIYVPKGSKLLEVQGQTREYNTPPLDYDTLRFKRDPQVEMEEQSIVYDENSGTRIYDDADKTVFANWVYVSPRETSEISYKYLLPFRTDLRDKSDSQNTYSLLIQKQSGSRGSLFSSEIIFPQDIDLIWNFPDEVVKYGNSLKYETDLKTDKFWGVAFSKK